MPCVHIETSRLKAILAALPALPPHNWLITDLDCVDYCDWDGCEKWAKQELFLTDEELRRDVNLRNMQILWGVFSAIPADISKEDVYKYPLPEAESPHYMGSKITPQHPLAMIELYAFDGSSIYVSACDASLLKPLYQLPYNVRDEDADNQVMNAQLRRIQDMLRAEVPDVSPEIANEVQWSVWHKLFRDNMKAVDDATLQQSIISEYRIQQISGQRHHPTYWDPYTQE